MNQKKYRILLADDDKEVREVVKRTIIGHYGSSAQIVEAVDGLDASNRINLQAFDLIITDLNMPKRTGNFFIADVRRSQYNNKSPVIIITGFAEDFDLSEFQYVGLLEKPFRSKQLVEEMEKQFKLGTIGNRLSSNIINYFVEACLIYLREILKLQPRIEKPTAAQGLNSLKGDFTCILDISGKTASGRFALCYDQNFIKYIQEVFSQKNDAFKTLSQVKMAETLSKFIFELINKKQLVPNDVFTIDHIECGENKDIKHSEKMNNAKSILIEIKTEKGNTFAQALTN